MKYENAKDILPAGLLAQVQKYAEGKVIYVPKTDKPKGWGEASGYREKLNRRNALIRSRYSSGRSIFEIAEEFFLSPETVKKLVYGKKTELPMFSPSIASAGAYASAGMGEEWVRTCLGLFNRTMPDISDYFMSELVKIPLRLIEGENGENTGNPGSTGNPGCFGSSGSEGSDGENAGMLSEKEGYFDVPLIVVYDDRKFCAPYQPGYLLRLRKDRKNAYPAFIFAHNDEYEYFWNNYGKHFMS